MLVTLKGAVRAREGQELLLAAWVHVLTSCGGRVTARASTAVVTAQIVRCLLYEAKKRFKIEDHIRMTQGVECHEDTDVIDDTPAAYKPIEAVMAAQADLIEIVHTLRHVVCVNG